MFPFVSFCGKSAKKKDLVFPFLGLTQFCFLDKLIIIPRSY